MKFLIDQNISRRLVAPIADAYPGTVHVSDTGLTDAADRVIWEYARDNGLTMLTKDSDFNNLAVLHGPPPKVVWIRLGNASTSEIADALLSQGAAIEAFAVSTEESVLVITRLVESG